MTHNHLESHDGSRVEDGNDHVIQQAGEAARKIAADHGLTLHEVLVYGSYAQETADESSDIDLVLVSPDWEGVDYYARPEPFLLEWPRDELPTPDIIPLTPSEFERRANEPADIVQTAVETGIVTG